MNSRRRSAALACRSSSLRSTPGALPNPGRPSPILPSEARPSVTRRIGALSALHPFPFGASKRPRGAQEYPDTLARVLIDFKALHEEADALAGEGRHDGPFFLAAILRHRSSQMSLQSIKRSASVVSVQAKDQQHHVFAHSHAQHVDFLKDSRFSRTMFHPGGT